jgi:hypothetical protein
LIVINKGAGKSLLRYWIYKDVIANFFHLISRGPSNSGLFNFML